MDKQIENRLEEVSTRISSASSILLSLKHIAFEKNHSAVAEFRDPKGKMFDWFVTYYDLIGETLWELSRTLEEQSEKIDEVLKTDPKSQEEESSISE